MKKVIIAICIIIVLLVIGYLIISNNQKQKDTNSVVNEVKTNNIEPQENTNKGEKEMLSLNIQIENKNFTATLEDNDTTRELVKQMPLTINMSELHGNEKYYYFNQSFPSNSERMARIENGDLMLYGSDCLVLFYESFSSGYSYTRLGKIDDPSDLANAVGSGSAEVTFSVNN